MRGPCRPAPLGTTVDAVLSVEIPAIELAGAVLDTADTPTSDKAACGPGYQQTIVDIGGTPKDPAGAVNAGRGWLDSAGTDYVDLAADSLVVLQGDTGLILVTAVEDQVMIRAYSACLPLGS